MDLHQVAPRLLYDFVDPDYLLTYTGPPPEIINKIGYFSLQDLHDVAPNLFFEEYRVVRKKYDPPECC